MKELLKTEKPWFFQREIYTESKKSLHVKLLNKTREPTSNHPIWVLKQPTNRTISLEFS